MHAKSCDSPVPLVVDADGLYLLNSAPHIVKGYANALLCQCSKYRRLASGYREES